MPCPNLAMVGCNVSIIVLYHSVWNFYALPVLYCLPLPIASSKFQYLSAEASIMYATIIQKSHAVLHNIHLYTAERLGQVSSSCWYTLHSSVSLEPTLDCSCRLWWPLLLHFGSYQWTLCLEEWAPHSQLQWQENITDGLTLLPVHICNLESPCTLIRMKNTHSLFIKSSGPQDQSCHM